MSLPLPLLSPLRRHRGWFVEELALLIKKVKREVRSLGGIEIL